MLKSKHKLLVLAGVATLGLGSLQAQIPKLRGYRYESFPKAPTGKEWESPEDWALNKQQPHAYFFSFASTTSATKVLPEHSEYYRSLDGKWKFRWVGNPEERSKDFYQPHFDASSWDEVDVPMSWNIYGISKKDGSRKYGTPIYVNQPVIFYHEVKPGDWKGGVMRTPPQNWTTYKDRNEVGAYRRTFSVPSNWDGRAVYINFDGVDSFFYLWVNGQYVGFSKNSRNLAQFDISAYLNKNGENVLAVEVYRSSDGSFLEAQDMFRLPGIFRSVYLTSKPQVQIRNIQIIPDLKGSNGELQVSAEVRNLTNSKQKDYSLNYSLYSLPLYSDATTLVNGVEVSTKLTVAQQATEEVKSTLSVENPKLWSAEAPYRYVLVAQLKDKKGKVVETISSYTGFRKVEIKDTPASEDEFGLAGRYFFVNNKSIKLKGVNRHETNPATGHVLSRKDMEEEIFLMQRANINHVRNSHYPDHPYWYYLCDKYGIYLEDEANSESHEYYYGAASLSHVPEFEISHVNRMLEMQYANINHPSIVIWSLGNEGGPGVNYLKAYQAAKKVDTSRPIQYERNNDIVDMGSNQYPSIGWVQGAVKGKYKIKYPFHISEYAHSMGNACGGLDDYWKAIESTNFFCGGAIWDWVDQAMYNYLPDGRRYLAYGGDFGDTPNDGMFVMNGIIFADRTPKPQYYEVKKVYQYVGIEAHNLMEAEVKIFNKHYFTTLSDYSIRWSIYKDGKEIENGTMAMPEISPRKSEIITIPYKTEIEMNSEYFLKISCILNTDKPWAKAGYIQAEEQLQLHKRIESVEHSGKAGKLKLGKVDKEGKLSIQGAEMNLSFDLKQGTIHSLSYGTQTLIEAGNGPKLYAFRAACDNDNWARGSWVANGLHNLKHKVQSYKIQQRKDGVVEIFVNVRSQAPNAASLYDYRASGRYRIDELKDKVFGPDDFRFDSSLIWTIYPDGTIQLRSSIHSNKPKAVLPRLGYEVVVPETYDNYTYYGRGPINNYGDRKSAQNIEQYTSKVKDQFVNFPKPQTMGNREEVRWTSLTKSDGSGLLFFSNQPMATSALPYSQVELLLAPHPYELPQGVRDTHLNLDLNDTGLGGFSCGQGPPLKQYQVYGVPSTFTLVLRPLKSGDNAGQLAKIALKEITAPIITRNTLGMLEIQGSTGDEFYYSVDKGKAKRYDGLIDLKKGGVVRAWNKLRPNYVVEETFSKIESVHAEVIYASNEEPSAEFAATNLVDGDPETIWHTMWSVTVAQYPHWIDFDIQSEKQVKGFTYLPRQDRSRNGDVKDYSIQTSLDGKTWTEQYKGSFEDSKELQKVIFPSPIKARYLRFTALSAHNKHDYAAGAEFSILAD